MKPITIRIWHGCTVRHVVTVSDTGSVASGATGGAEDSTPVDIELDPWAGLIVDNRDNSRGRATPIYIDGQQ